MYVALLGDLRLSNKNIATGQSCIENEPGRIKAQKLTELA